MGMTDFPGKRFKHRGKSPPESVRPASRNAAEPARRAPGRQSPGVGVPLSAFPLTLRLCRLACTFSHTQAPPPRVSSPPGGQKRSSPASEGAEAQGTAHRPAAHLAVRDTSPHSPGAPASSPGPWGCALNPSPDLTPAEAAAPISVHCPQSPLCLSRRLDTSLFIRTHCCYKPPSNLNSGGSLLTSPSLGRLSPMLDTGIRKTTLVTAEGHLATGREVSGSPENTYWVFCPVIINGNPVRAGSVRLRH